MGASWYCRQRTTRTVGPIGMTGVTGGGAIPATMITLIIMPRHGDNRHARDGSIDAKGSG